MREQCFGFFRTALCRADAPQGHPMGRLRNLIFRCFQRGHCPFRILGGPREIPPGEVDFSQAPQEEWRVLHCAVLVEQLAGSLNLSLSLVHLAAPQQVHPEVAVRIRLPNDVAELLPDGDRTGEVAHARDGVAGQVFDDGQGDQAPRFADALVMRARQPQGVQEQRFRLRQFTSIQQRAAQERRGARGSLAFAHGLIELQRLAVCRLGFGQPAAQRVGDDAQQLVGFRFPLPVG